MDNIRNHQFFVSIDDEPEIMIHQQELKMGANYQFVYINTSNKKCKVKTIKTQYAKNSLIYVALQKHLLYLSVAEKNI